MIILFSMILSILFHEEFMMLWWIHLFVMDHFCLYDIWPTNFWGVLSLCLLNFDDASFWICTYYPCTICESYQDVTMMFHYMDHLLWHDIVWYDMTYLSLSLMMCVPFILIINTTVIYGCGMFKLNVDN